ncbi:MAG: glycosyltransferase family 4 protein [Candidatus Omnitrophica bacterium]|nr:glycosyltransferase family 4 protein [Candidatus Omnitrophota bacterium]
MKVIFVTREGYGLSGARVRCYNFARELAVHHIEAQVFSFADELGARHGEGELRMSFLEKLVLNCQAFRRLWRSGSDVTFVLQRLNYHVLAPLLVALLRKQRVIFDCDDWNIRENPVYYLGFYPSSKMEYFTRILARRASLCIVASDFLREYLCRFNPSTYYLPTAVDTDFFRPSLECDHARVVFSWVGTAYHPEMGENLRFLVSCFSALADEYDNVFLSMAGEGKYFDEIKSDLTAYSHMDRVEWRPWVHPDKMPEYLSAIDVGLLPLIQDTKFNRAKSPTKLFEYMSMGKATISSDIGEASHIIRDRETGLLFRDREGWISGMRMLVSDPEFRSKVGLRAREAVEREYSLKVVVSRLAEVLEGVGLQRDK